jgi:cytochrome P450
MSAIFEQVLWRLPNIELNGEPEHLISNFQNGPKHLPVKWDNE